MSENENMTSKLQNKSQAFYKLTLKTIKLQLKLNGTKFVVLRPKENSKWKTVFGGTYSSNDTLENDYTELSTTLVINNNDRRDVWNRNRDSLEAWTNDDNLNVGDELQYTRDGRTYRFKITLKQGYSELSNSLFVYTLTSIIETLDL